MIVPVIIVRTFYAVEFLNKRVYDMSSMAIEMTRITDVFA